MKETLVMCFILLMVSLKLKLWEISVYFIGLIITILYLFSGGFKIKSGRENEIKS